jgi:hypothetical protein
MAVIKGDNVLVYIYDNAQWKLFACARSCELSVDTEMIETSISGTGNFSTFKPTKNSYTGKIDGLVTIDESGALSLADLRQLQIAHQLLSIRYQRTDIDSNIYTDECTFYITNTSDSANFDDLNVFSVDLQGTGGITQIFTPTTQLTGKMKRYEYVGLGGEMGFTEPLLIGKDIQIANKDGIGNAALITSGTPASKEVKYVSATGDFEWAIPFETGEIAVINYQDI